jgi:hypothetical protein
MAPSEITQLRLTLGALRLEYEGRDEFLKSEVPTLVQGMDQLLTSRLIVPFNTLQTAIVDSLTTLKDIEDAIASLRAQRRTPCRWRRRFNLRLGSKIRRSGLRCGRATIELWTALVRFRERLRRSPRLNLHAAEKEQCSQQASALRVAALHKILQGLP